MTINQSLQLQGELGESWGNILHLDSSWRRNHKPPKMSKPLKSACFQKSGTFPIPIKKFLVVPIESSSQYQIINTSIQTYN